VTVLESLVVTGAGLRQIEEERGKLRKKIGWVSNCHFFAGGRGAGFESGW
jgi:hypothetical protein